MDSLTKFKAIYCSGLFIPDPSTVTALALLFEKIYLPSNFEIVKEFSKKYRIEYPINSMFNFSIVNQEDLEKDDFLAELTGDERKIAMEYIKAGFSFSFFYSPLFTDIFETDLFQTGRCPNIEDLINAIPKPVGRKHVRTIRNNMVLSIDDHETFPRLITEGYIPVVGKVHLGSAPTDKLDYLSAKNLSTLLAMQAIEMIFPGMKGVHPEILLETRHRLADHLPPFWSSMLKLSVELKRRIKECRTSDQIVREGQELIDTIVRPSLIDLKAKMLKEKKDWFYKILSPVRKALRVMIGNPPLTQQQLITNALVLSSDLAMSAAENMRTIEALKNEAGLTFLLKAEKELEK